MLSFSILLLCVVIDLEKCRIYTEFVLYIFPVVEGECTRKWSRIDPKFTRKVVKFSFRPLPRAARPAAASAGALHSVDAAAGLAARGSGRNRLLTSVCTLKKTRTKFFSNKKIHIYLCTKVQY